MSRITQGRISLRKEPADLAEILARAVESTRALCEARGVTVDLAAEPAHVEGDPARLEQVFVNLLSNAAKYTDAGGRVDVSLERRAGEAVVRVRDTGIGIASDMLPRIWDLFRQGDRALDRAPGGLGIGLIVARRLVELHGGRIQAASDGLGKGAEFAVTLRAASRASAPARERPAPGEERPAAVLIVDDNPDTAESLALLLQLRGHRARTVPDGHAALDAVRTARPDAMLVDIGLPRHRRLRGRGAAAPGSGDGEAAAHRPHRLRARRGPAACARGGFDHHLVKPVDPDARFRLLARAAGEPGRVD